MCHDIIMEQYKNFNDGTHEPHGSIIETWEHLGPNET